MALSAIARSGARLLGLCTLGSWLFSVGATTSYIALSPIWLFLAALFAWDRLFPTRCRRPSAMRIKILHVINSFEYGGAEAMLCNLLSRADRGRFQPEVVSLIDDLRLAGGIISAEIPLTVLGMEPGVPDPRGVTRLARVIRQVRPLVIQTWMDHSNLIGGLAARLSGRAPVVWGVHHSNHIPGLTKRTTLMTVAACARLSRRLPARIVCCSESSRARLRIGGELRRPPA